MILDEARAEAERRYVGDYVETEPGIYYLAAGLRTGWIACAEWLIEQLNADLEQAAKWIAVNLGDCEAEDFAHEFGLTRGFENDLEQPAVETQDDGKRRTAQEEH